MKADNQPTAFDDWYFENIKLLNVVRGDDII